MTQTEEMKTRNRTRTNKVRSIFLKVIGAIMIAIVLFLVIVYTVNLICNQSELRRIEPYGQHVSVDGKNMNVLIQGAGEETVVLLPGLGIAAPALDFKPLIEELSPFYKVVVVEPFGYGLSDLTEKERTTENVVSEIHEALQGLNIKRYILMGHSISGVYGLEYVNKYENEVSTFVGLDSSVPTLSEKVKSSQLEMVKWLKQSGLSRLAMKLGTDPLAALPYDDKTKEQMRMLMHKNMYNPNLLNEVEHMQSNFKAAESVSFPKNLPIIFFIQANHPVTDRWVPEHEEQVKNSVHGKVIRFEADHYIHRTKAKEITENLREFMKEIK
ncbi:alpha/beta hydrolase [Paenibacillus profundus]|uniref:Alpha/beta hydrolase n=1 Tax=Paenibacillus profundus TaxID=1173085 RepID=A0ABS8YMA7_9BACL|nr:alpha/beta hydrolase [Paenibacillus profundus]MCE5172319.1 alpha/beta hydrolase [Paenibacillus profundus]